MTERESLNGKPYAGTPHVRFDEGEVASATPRRGSLLYKIRTADGGGCVIALVAAFAASVVLGAEIHFTGPLASPGIGRKTIPVRVIGAPDGTVVSGTLRCGSAKIATLRPFCADELKFKVRKYGLYTLDVAAVGSDGMTNATVSTTYAVVPHINERPRTLGTCTHFAFGKGSYPLLFDLMRMAGISRLRDDISWEYMERSPGVYSVPDNAEAFVSRCEEYKMKPLIVFGFPNGKCYPNGFKDKPFPTDDTTRKACADALAFLVARFGKRVEAWELWNEPNFADPVKDYLPLLKFVYPAVKAANPAATLLSCGGAGAGGGPGGAFIDPILHVGGQDFQDGWTIHPYMSPNTPDYGYDASGSPTIKIVNVEESCKYLLGNAAKYLRSDKKPLELWVSEVGWSSAQNSDDLQAAYLVRLLLLYRRHAPDTPVFIYDFQNDGVDPANMEQNFGLIRKDYSPKQSFQAIAVAASMLKNRAFTDALVDGEDCRIYGYGASGKAEVYAAWNVGKCWKKPDAPAMREVEVKLPAGRWQLVDWQGRLLPLKRASGGKTVLKLENRPSWLIAR